MTLCEKGDGHFAKFDNTSPHWAAKPELAHVNEFPAAGF
tara:strand:+ start:1615 stop:1731 length:117 start_codon:yes stop_codon:yes gene_type:complete